MTRICSFDGCGKVLNSHNARGMCTGHYQQWQRGEELRQLEPRNVCVPWLLAHVDHDEDECLTWPFTLRGDGRPQIKWHGKMTYAYRIMCALTHGEPPEGKPEAIHSCGNGHLGCVNPKHLRWGSDKDNKADMLAHGTRVRGEKQGSAKLTTEAVVQMRAMAGKAPQHVIGAMFGVSQTQASRVIRGKHWGHV